VSKSKPAYRSSAPAVVTRAPEYLSKEIVAKRLGLSVRRVLELSARGTLKRRAVVDPGTKRKQTVFRADDVAAVIDGQKRLVAYRGGADVAAAVPPLPAISAPPPAHDRPWLTVDEAAEYSGLPASFLLQMIGDRRLAALDVGVRAGGRFRISRRAIDAIEAPIAQTRVGKSRAG
jgi:excisionase family DNA binding protein